LDDCIFCRIIKKEIPARILHEDEDFLVILDAFPSGLGHTLILPKRHIPDILALDGAELERLAPLIKETAGRLKDALGFDGLNVLQNNGPAAGQTVFHLHAHLIPRWEGDRVNVKWPVKKDLRDEEIDEFVRKVKF
jgi:histidine triad (HIT) family protein